MQTVTNARFRTRPSDHWLHGLPLPETVNNPSANLRLGGVT